MFAAGVVYVLTNDFIALFGAEGSQLTQLVLNILSLVFGGHSAVYGDLRRNHYVRIYVDTHVRQGESYQKGSFVERHDVGWQVLVFQRCRKGN